MTFGRRGLASGGEFGPGARPRMALASPLPASVAIDEPASQRNEDRVAGTTLVFVAIGVIVILLTLDVLLSYSSLITPLPKDLTWYTSATGAALGLLAGVYAWLTWSSARGSVRVTLGLFILLPCLGGTWANLVTWQIARDVQFTLSNAPWEKAEYPVTRLTHRKGRSALFESDSASINPYKIGSGIEIPIPRDQSHEFPGAREGDLCITVFQRRSASGAIEVLTDGTMNLRSPERADIHHC